MLRLSARADQAAHTFRWIVAKKAAEIEKGFRYAKCTVCEYKKLPRISQQPALR